MLRGQQTPAPHSQPGIRQRVWNITGLQKFLLNILYLRTWIFQRKDFRQDPHGASCQYQTTVFQDKRVSPDVIPDTFTHVNKCQDFTAPLSNPKQVRCVLKAGIVIQRPAHQWKLRITLSLRSLAARGGIWATAEWSTLRTVPTRPGSQKKPPALNFLVQIIALTGVREK